MIYSKSVHTNRQLLDIRRISGYSRQPSKRLAPSIDNPILKAHPPNIDVSDLSKRCGPKLVESWSS